jgi:hypothetical protein
MAMPKSEVGFHAKAPARFGTLLIKVSAGQIRGVSA